MSSPAQGGPSVPKEKEKKGLGKMISRMKTVLKKADPSKRISTMSAKAGPSTAPVLAEEAPASAPAPAETPKELAPGTTKVPRSQIYEERAKKLGERFGLEIKPTEWYTSEGHALRIEKPIKMRVHRQCHVCQHTFGLTKECPKCKHVRCKECKRIPPKRTEAEKEESRKKRAAMLRAHKENAPIIPDWDPVDKKIVLRRPGKAGGQDLVYKRPRQRIRRNCCQCTKLLLPGSKKCESCDHVRCTDCPRDPAKKSQFPYGYPGDVFGQKSIPHFECHECKTVFPPNPSEDTECPSCKHKKCGDCQRVTPRKVEPEPDPDVWKTVQAKLEELKIK